MGESFDRLPDDVSVSILERLKWKDAAATSILSHSFNRVWKSFLHKKFLHKNILAVIDTNAFREGFQYQSRSCFQFVEFVNYILRIHKESNADSLRIASVKSLDDSYYMPDDIEPNNFVSRLKECFENWLTFARAKRLRSLDINLDHLTSSWCIDMPDFRLQFPRFEGFDNLTSLSLVRVDIDDEELEHGLRSHLVNLESLVIYGPISLTRLKIMSEKLKINSCDNIHTIDIHHAPNLQCFKQYKAGLLLVNFQFNHVPKLSHVSISGGLFCQNNTLELGKIGLTLEKLKLEMAPRCLDPEHVECMRNPPHFPVLANLKQLELEFAINEDAGILLMIFSVILPACPKLRKLTLKYHKCWGDFMFVDEYWSHLNKRQLRAISHKHYRLKEVAFTSWTGDETEVEARKYLRKVAPNLKKITYT